MLRNYLAAALRNLARNRLYAAINIVGLALSLAAALLIARETGVFAIFPAVAVSIAGYLMNRWLHGFFYHVGLDWWLFAASGIAALILALATVTTRSLMVARTQPVTALRYE